MANDNCGDDWGGESKISKGPSEGAIRGEVKNAADENDRGPKSIEKSFSHWSVGRRADQFGSSKSLSAAAAARVEVKETSSTTPPQRIGSALEEATISESEESENAARDGEDKTSLFGAEETRFVETRQRLGSPKESKGKSARKIRDGGGRTDEDDDPHDLYERFVRPQRAMFPRALCEIRAGMKESCWLWFVLPTPPYVVNGVERGSGINRRMALRGDAAAAAYLRFERRDGVHLRSNYLAVAEAVRDQLEGGNNMGWLFGPMDEPKAMSSFRFFERIAGHVRDEELRSACGDVLRLAETPSRGGGFRRGHKKKKEHSF